MSSLIDRSSWEKWFELEREGHPGFFNELIEIVLASVSEQLLKLEAAFERQESKAIFHYSHSLKSTFRQIGAFSLADFLEKIEIEARTAQPTFAPGAVLQVRQQSDLICAELASVLKQRKT